MQEGTRVVVQIESMAEIPMAYQKAIEVYKNGMEDYVGDIWNAKIELKQVSFEHNFRRHNYECVFEITIGEFLE